MINLVGVSLRTVENTGYKESRDAISHDWIRLLSKYQVTPLLIPNVLTNLQELLDEFQFSALLLSNGNNIGPINDNEKHLDIIDVSADRDKTEHEIIEFAVKNRIPILGVCRGMQIINTHFGGELVRDLSEIGLNPDTHVAKDHETTFTDSKFRDKIGTAGAVTNSYHRNAVTLSTLSKQLCPFALAGDNIVEGLYHPDLPIIGIQWHIERSNPAAEIDETLIKTWLGQE